MFTRVVASFSSLVYAWLARFFLLATRHKKTEEDLPIGPQKHPFVEFEGHFV
jgi:hypothetical protein